MAVKHVATCDAPDCTRTVGEGESLEGWAKVEIFHAPEGVVAELMQAFGQNANEFFVICSLGCLKTLASVKLSQAASSNK